MSGNSENILQEGDMNPTPKEDKVSYETHQKLLKQLKENQVRMRELEEKQKLIEEKAREEEEVKLKEQQKWKEIAERKDTEIKKEQERVKLLEKKFVNSLKEREFKEALGFPIKPKFLSFVDFDDISLDTDGFVDKITLENVVNKFKEENPELLPKKESKEDIPSGNKSSNKSLPIQKANDVNLGLQDIKNMTPAQLLEMYKKVKKEK